MPEEIFEDLGIPYAETCFLPEQYGTRLVYGIKSEAEGSDHNNELRRNTVTAELIEEADAQDPAAHARLQRLLDEAGRRWAKDDRIFYEDVRLFVTTYTFEFLERRN